MRYGPNNSKKWWSASGETTSLVVPWLPHTHAHTHTKLHTYVNLPYTHQKLKVTSLTSDICALSTQDVGALFAVEQVGPPGAAGIVFLPLKDGRHIDEDQLLSRPNDSFSSSLLQLVKQNSSFRERSVGPTVLG